MVSFHDHADALAAGGYHPIPIRPYSKRPAIDEWEKYEHGISPRVRVPASCGTGVLTGLLRPIDVDITRADLAAEVRQQAIAVWGANCIRIGMAPKCAIMVRTAAAAPKLKSLQFRFVDDAPGAAAHCVEILGLGQQIVVEGFHPVTRQPYSWEGGDLLEHPLLSLPIATENELYGFLQWVNNRMLEAGGIPCGRIAKEDHAARTPHDELAANDPAECIEAIKALANDDLHWDDWIYVGLAIKGALGEAGLPAWHEFSRQSSKYDPELTARAYRSFDPDRIGAGTLYRMAFAAGWDRPIPSVDISGLLAGRTDTTTPLLLDYDGLTRAVGPLSWLTKGVIPSHAIGSVYGASGTFKSFIVLDGCLHLAHDRQWLGRRTRGGGVAYVAAEGGTGLLARITAWHKHHQLDPRAARFRACITPLTLDKAADLKRLSDALDAELDHLGSIALIVLDTMSQTMSGDENEARDTAAYLRAIGGWLRDRFRCAILIVHHTGKDAARGPRGSSAIRGNLDFLFEVERTEGAMAATLTVRKQKDGRDGDAFPFALERHVIGRDEDGDDVSSLVAVYHDAVGAIIANASGRATKYEAWLLEIIGNGKLYADSRDEFYAKCGEDKPDTKKKAFARAIKSLLESGRVVDRNNCLFPSVEK